MFREIHVFLSQFCSKNKFVNLFHFDFCKGKQSECFFRIFEEKAIANSPNIVISRFSFENSKIPSLETFLTKLETGACLAVGSERGDDEVREFMLSFVFSVLQNNSECISKIQWTSDQKKTSDPTKLDPW